MESTLPRLPDALRRLDISLRPQTDDDQSFLLELYRSVRWEELAPVDWPDDTKLAFLDHQFQLQTTHYKRFYYDAAFGIVEAVGEPIGRLYLIVQPGDLRIVDISLLPQWRGRGIGGRLIGTVFEQAREQGLPVVSIHVEQFNPARRLYDRLGFKEIEVKGPYILMKAQIDR